MNIIDKVVELLSKEGMETTFVFTSEVVARSYLEACARKNPKRAVFEDCAISWDTFQGKFTSYPRDRVRAVFTDRLLFVKQYFASSDAMKKLKYYCDSSYECSKPAYIRSIAKALPDMCRAFEPGTMKLLDITRENAPEEMQRDLLLLVPAYKAYLDERGLYETALYEPDFTKVADDGSVAADYTIVFPETFSNPAVLKALRVCRHINIDTHEKRPKLRLYNNSVSEIRGCMREVYKLLTHSVHPDDIAITCADYDAYKPYLEQEAFKRDIHLSFNKVMPVSSYAPGAFFRALERVIEENYSFRSMKALLLDLRFPYKGRDLLAGIIEKAVKCKCKDGPLENWINKFWKLCNRDGKHIAVEEARRLDEIRKSIQRVAECDDPSELKRNIIILVKDIFDDGEWTEMPEEGGIGIKVEDGRTVNERSGEDEETESPEKGNDDIKAENARIFGLCMHELDNLSSHAEGISFGKDGSLFGFFVDILRDKTYRPNTGKGSINVYEYPVSAGLAVKYHFTLGLTDSNSKILRNPYPFLPLNTAKTMDDVKALEDSVIRLYGGALLDGFSRMSSAEESFSGADVVPTLFLKGDRVRKIEKKVESDSFDEELSIWTEAEKNAPDEKSKTKTGPTLRITQKQKDCFDRAYESGLKYGNDMSFASVSASLTISVSKVKEFETCPYRGYAYSKLGLDDLKFEPDMADAAGVGNILHETVQDALAEAGTFASINPDRLGEIFNQKVDEYEGKTEATDSVHVAYIRKKYIKDIADILKCVEEAEGIDEHTEKGYLIKLGKMYSLYNEYEASAFTPDETSAIRFEGRMDCILENDEELAVIDLKKDGSKHYGGTLDKCNLQVAIYARMLKEDPGFKEKKKPVTIGAFYSFKDGKFLFVWPRIGGRSNSKNYFYDENSKVDGVKGNITEYVENNYKERVMNLDRIVREHDFAPKPKGNTSCDNCPFYNLCRKGFQTV